MDQVIYEEFKSTGNSEVVLDRSLAEEHIFPAINVHQTGTCKEERLYSPGEMARLAALRRALAGHPAREAMLGLLKIIGQTRSNEEMLLHLAV